MGKGVGGLERVWVGTGVVGRSAGVGGYGCGWVRLWVGMGCGWVHVWVGADVLGRV